MTTKNQDLWWLSITKYTFLLEIWGIFKTYLYYCRFARYSLKNKTNKTKHKNRGWGDVTIIVEAVKSTLSIRSLYQARAFLHYPQWRRPGASAQIWLLNLLGRAELSVHRCQPSSQLKCLFRDQICPTWELWNVLQWTPGFCLGCVLQSQFQQ